MVPLNQFPLLAYCLLPNQTHFLIRKDGECSAGMLPQRVLNTRSKAFNKRCRHSGTLSEGPYRIRPVLEDSYLLHLCRCIHANPVKHGLADDPGDWPFSTIWSRSASVRELCWTVSSPPAISHPRRTMFNL
jgi:putative transposase